MKTLIQESERLTHLSFARDDMMESHVGPLVLRVFDDVLDDPLDYEARARGAAFHSVSVGLATFHGIADAATGQPLLAWLRDSFPLATPTLSFFRESPACQVEPNFIHTDRDMGNWTAIFYLNEHPADGDGTTFWIDRRTGESYSREADVYAEGERWNDLQRWEPVVTVAAKLNRVVVFSAPFFHSRALFDNYGESGKDARLIQVVFGAGSLEQPS